MKIGTRIKLNLKETTQLHDQYGTVAIIPEVEGLVGIQLDQFHEIPSLTWSANDLIEGDAIMLEREPMEIVASKGELMAYKHEGFWHCMDTKRDHELLEALWLKGAPWTA